MTGPEHYREAQLLLSTGCEYMCPHSGCEHEAVHVARAQAHATLALAAAMADGPSVMRPEDRDEWDQVTGRAER